MALGEGVLLKSANTELRVATPTEEVAPPATASASMVQYWYDQRTVLGHLAITAGGTGSQQQPRILKKDLYSRAIQQYMSEQELHSSTHVCIYGHSVKIYIEQV